MYLTAQSCLHIVINYLRPPQADQTMPYLSLITSQYQILQNLRKDVNSVEMGKFRSLAQHSAFGRQLWSLTDKAG